VTADCCRPNGKAITYGSLFTGIAGFDLGFDRAGLQGQWQVEKDKDCNRVLSRHYAGTQRGCLVEEVTPERFGRVDVICGGFPCQDLSVAGKRKGLAGERSGLWHQFHRIIAEFEPRGFVIENVPGLFSSNDGLDLLTVLRGLAELRYCLAWGVLDSQYRGVPQRRDRVFIVGSLGNGRCAEILFESESVRGDSAPSREAWERIADAVTTGVGKGSGPRNGNGTPINLQISATVSSKWAKGSGGPAGDECQNLIVHTLRGEGFDASEDGTGRATPIIAFTSKDHGADAERELSPTLRSMGHDKSHSNGGGQVAIACFDERSVTSPDNRQSCRPDRSQALNGSGDIAVAFEHNQNWMEMHEEHSPPLTNSHGGAPAVAFTLPGSSKTRRAGFETEIAGSVRTKAPGSIENSSTTVAVSRMMVRRLTPRECERLQGFPDDWTRWDAEGKEISDSARYRMLGNAVTVSVAEWIGERIVSHLN
jgi:DNA (cytosine-5)-methyltransferase 1